MPLRVTSTDVDGATKIANYFPEFTLPNGNVETAYPFGHYLMQMITDAKAAGVHPVERLAGRISEVHRPFRFLT